MKQPARKHVAKRRSSKIYRSRRHPNKIRPKAVHKVVFLDLNAAEDKIVKTGDVDPGTNGNVTLGPSDKLTFKYLTGTETFALFITGFTPATPGIGGPDETPFLRVSSTENGKLENVVKSTAKKGQYDYQLFLLKSDGTIVAEDPQIIVQ